MNLEAVSCICITHNRVKELKNSIKCFEAQSHSNKELLVLYHNDKATKQFVKENGFTLYMLTKDNRDPAYKFVRSDTQNKYYLLNAFDENFDPLKEKWVNKKQNYFDCQFTDKKLVVSYREKFLTYDFKAMRFKIGRFPYHFNYGFQLDGSIIPELNGNPVLPHDNLETLGWNKQLAQANPHGNIIFFELSTDMEFTLGMKRNLAIKLALNDIICIWDDDDLYHPERLKNQSIYLKFSDAGACTLANTLLLDTKTNNLYLNRIRSIGHENTILFRKSLATIYSNKNRGEDTPFLQHFYHNNNLAVMEDPHLYMYHYHGNNTSSEAHFNSIFQFAMPVKGEDKHCIIEAYPLWNHNI